MKKKISKKKKAKETLWNRVLGKASELIDWVLFNWDDENLLFGGLLVLFGGGLLLGWLNPVAWLGWTSIAWGVAKMYKVLR